MVESGATSMEDDAPGTTGGAAGSSPPGVDAKALARIVDRRQRADGEPWLHGEVARRMAERLVLFAVRPRRIIQWWGPRAGGAEWHAAYPSAEIRFAAPAASAGDVARRRHDEVEPRAWWRRLGRRGSSADADRAWSDDAVPAASAQLLWANMVMHASSDVTTLLRRWHAALEVEGTLMFSTVGPDTLRELRELYRDEGWGPCGVEPRDMHDIGDALVHAGFADPVMDQERLTLHWADPQALTAELRTLGANAAPLRHAGLRTPRWRQRLHDALLARAVDGRIALTFEVVYGHAFKVDRRGDGSTIALDDVAASLPSRRRARLGRQAT